jgi:autotransporter-associated beta strand protein
VVKANNADDLNLTTSWVGGVVPTANERAKWDSTVTAANTTSLGSDLTISGIVIANPAGPVTISPGNTLTLGTELVDIDLSTASQDLTLNCNLNMGAPNVWDVASGRTLTLGGIVSGTGVTIQGSGTTILQGANTWAGGATVSGGTLKLAAAEVIPNGTGTGNLTLNATLDLNGFSEQINGLNGAGIVDNTAAGTTSTFTIGNNNQAGSFTGILQNSGSSASLELIKNGTGALTLSGANTHSGLTTINGGAVTIQNGGALGTTAAGTIVNGTGTGNASNARLDLSGGITVTGEAITISGVGNFYGALSAASGNNEWAGNMTIGASGTRLGALAAAILKVSGVIDSGANPHGLVIRSTNITDSTVILSNANTYLGDTWVAVGKLQLEGGANRLPVTTKMSMGATTNVSEFDLNGTNQELAGLTITPGSTAVNNAVNNSSATLSTLTLNTTDSPSAFAGILQGNLALTKSGTNTLTLAGANTYTGATQVTAGTLLFSTAGLGASDVSVSSGAAAGAVVAATDGQAISTGDLSMANNSVLTIDYGTTNPSTTVAPIAIDNFTAGTGLSLLLKGANLAALTPSQSYPLVTWAANGPADGTSFTTVLNPRIKGTFSVSGKTLLFTVTANTDGTPISWNTGNGTWDTATANWFDVNLASTTFFDTFDAVRFGDATGVTGNPVVTLNTAVSPTGVVMNSSSRNYTISGTGSIGGNASLTLDPANTGTLTLTTANTFTGTAAVNGGTLQLGNGGAEGSLAPTGPISIATGATFAVNQSDTVAQGTEFSTAAISGAGNFAQTGAGTTILNAANTYSGQTLVSAGTLQAAVNPTANGLGTSAVAIGAGTTVVLENTHTASGATFTLSNTFSGTGLLNVRFAANANARNLLMPGVTGFEGTIRLSSLGATGDKWSTGTLGALPSSLIVDSGNTLYIPSGTPSFTGGITLNGAGNTEGRGAIRLSNGTLGGNIKLASDTSINLDNAAAVLSGDISSGATGTQTLTLGATASTGGTLSGVIGGGTGTLNLATAVGGTYTLTNANTYTGTTTINAGILQLGNVAALGGDTPGVNASSEIIMAGGTLRSNINNVVVHSPIKLTGAAATINAPAVGTTGGAVFTLFLNGAISGTGDLSLVGVQGSNTFGTIHLGAASSYTGNTLLTTTNTGGTLFVVAGVENALPPTTVLTLNGGAGSGTGRTLRLDLNGFNQTLAGLTNVNGLNLRNQRITSTTGLPTLTINNTDNFSFGGTVNGTTATFCRLEGTLALTKKGVGTMTLTGASNTHTGATTVLGGVLVLGHQASLQNSPLDTLNSVTGDANNGLATTVSSLTLGGLSGSKNLASVFTTFAGGYDLVTALTLNPGTGATPAYSGIIADGAVGMSLSKSGPGTQTLAGANTYTGETAISGGTLALGASNVIPNASALSIGAATLDAGTFTDTIGALDPTAAATINLGAGAALAFADSNAVDWTGGTLAITGTFVSGSSLRFGTSASSLNATQLGLISATGFAGFALDADGYLTATPAGYSAWAATNAGGQAANLDFDNDGTPNGVEFFMNAAAGFTVNPQLNGTNTITWPNGGNIPASAYGTQFVVQTSPDLATWTEVPVGDLTTNTDGPGGSLTYTLTGAAPRFVRLKVTPN